jgi:hypothetical protein
LIAETGLLSGRVISRPVLKAGSPASFIGKENGGEKAPFFADDRTRTSTLLLGADFESAASAISPHRQGLSLLGKRGKRSIFKKVKKMIKFF